MLLGVPLSNFIFFCPCLALSDPNSDNNTARRLLSQRDQAQASSQAPSRGDRTVSSTGLYSVLSGNVTRSRDADDGGTT